MDEQEKSDKLEEIKENLLNRDSATWHKILMGFAVVMAGLIAVSGIVIKNALDRAKEQAIQTPLVSLSATNKILPDGQYYIHRIFMDEAKVLHLIVSDKQGGVVVAVQPPPHITITYPQDFVTAEMENPSAYALHVEDGRWIFLGTSQKKD